MTFSTFQIYLRAFLPHIPCWHWAVIGAASSAAILFLLTRKKCSTYGLIAFGLAVFIGIYLLDALVLKRIGVERALPPGFDFGGEYYRLVKGNEEHRILMLFNVTAFVPFGFFLSEFFSEMRGLTVGKRFDYVVLGAFGLSLVIECLQLVLRVGIFEVTDLVLNTLGAAVGAAVAMAGRGVIKSLRKKTV